MNGMTTERDLKLYMSCLQKGDLESKKIIKFYYKNLMIYSQSWQMEEEFLQLHFIIHIIIMSSGQWKIKKNWLQSLPSLIPFINS